MLVMISNIPKRNDTNGGRRSTMSYVESDDCQCEMLLSISAKGIDIGRWHRSEMLHVRRRLRLQPIHWGLCEKQDSMSQIMPFLRLHLLAHVLIFLSRCLLTMAFLLLVLTALVTVRITCGSSRQCFRSCTSNIFGQQCFRTAQNQKITQAQQLSIQCLIVGNAQDGRHLVGAIHRQTTISCVMPKTLARGHYQEQRQNQKHTQT